jgi:hypothetical protein
MEDDPFGFALGPARPFPLPRRLEGIFCKWCGRGQCGMVKNYPRQHCLEVPPDSGSTRYVEEDLGRRNARPQDSDLLARDPVIKMAILKISQELLAPYERGNLLRAVGRIGWDLRLSEDGTYRHCQPSFWWFLGGPWLDDLLLFLKDSEAIGDMGATLYPNPFT